MVTVLETVKIVSSPDILGGKPRIEGRRISVQNIVKHHLHGGMSLEEMQAAFGLSPAEIYAALSYYHLHQTEIEQSIRGDREAHEAGLNDQSRKLYLLDHGLSTQQASEQLGIGERAVRNLIEANTLVAMKIGGQWYIDPASLTDEQVKNRRGPGRPTKPNAEG